MNNGSFMNNINYKPYLWEIRKYPEYSTSSDVLDEDRLIHTGNFIIVDPKNLIGIPVMSTLQYPVFMRSVRAVFCDIRQIAVLLAAVKPVAYHEIIRNGEQRGICLEIHHAP